MQSLAILNVLRDYLVTAKALVKETFMIWTYYSWQWARRD